MSKTMSSWKWIAAAMLVLALAAGCFGGSGRNAGQGGPEVTDTGVVFRFYDPDASNVCIVGDFNGWSPGASAMVDKNADGQWTLFCDLPPGVYAYKIVVDGVRWIPDPKNPDRVPDGFESENSVLRMPPR